MMMVNGTVTPQRLQVAKDLNTARMISHLIRVRAVLAKKSGHRQKMKGSPKLKNLVSQKVPRYHK